MHSGHHGAVKQKHTITHMPCIVSTWLALKTLPIVHDHTQSCKGGPAPLAGIHIELDDGPVLGHREGGAVVCGQCQRRHRLPARTPPKFPGSARQHWPYSRCFYTQLFTAVQGCPCRPTVRFCNPVPIQPARCVIRSPEILMWFAAAPVAAHEVSSRGRCCSAIKLSIWQADARCQLPM